MSCPWPGRNQYHHFKSLSTTATTRSQHGISVVAIFNSTSFLELELTICQRREAGQLWLLRRDLVWGWGHLLLLSSLSSALRVVAQSGPVSSTCPPLSSPAPSLLASVGQQVSVSAWQTNLTPSSPSSSFLSFSSSALPLLCRGGVS